MIQSAVPGMKIFRKRKGLTQAKLAKAIGCSASEVSMWEKGVITSPPYCNRYDYTRTYALELAYLGVDEDSIKKCDRTCCRVQ